MTVVPTQNDDYAVLINRGTDALGYSVAPITSCCHTFAVAQVRDEFIRKPAGQFVPVHGVCDDFGPMRCGRCNRPVIVEECDMGHKVWSNGLTTFHVNPAEDDLHPGLTQRDRALLDGAEEADW